jgi:hypothetical protein
MRIADLAVKYLLLMNDCAMLLADPKNTVIRPSYRSLMSKILAVKHAGASTTGRIGMWADRVDRSYCGI